MPPRRGVPQKKLPSPPKPVEKKKYCGGLKENTVDGELYWADDRARSSSQYTVRLLANEEERTKEIIDGLTVGRKMRHVGGRARSPSPETELRGNTTGYISPERGSSSGGSSAAVVLHSAMTAAQPVMTREEREEYYERTYPYNFIRLKDLKETTSSVETVYLIQSQIGAEKSRTMEATILSLRYLEDTERMDLKRCTFVDLMAFRGEALLYASAFGFPRLITLELSEKSKQDAIRIIGRIAGLSERSTVLIGSFHDYFICDAQVYYMDCTRVINSRKMGDEGIIVNAIFKLFKTLQPGAFLILMTTMTHFSAASDFLAPQMKQLLKTVIHKDHDDEATLWVYGLDFNFHK